MVFRIGTYAHLYDDPDDVSISPLLDSKFDSEKCDTLKRLLALIAQGLDLSNYFPRMRFVLEKMSSEFTRNHHHHPGFAQDAVNCLKLEVFIDDGNGDEYSRECTICLEGFDDGDEHIIVSINRTETTLRH
ncbi:hypothetical protein L2E82_45108 [Cichorium intybus]|uniref:Uncharacterized protein n=1 Tax=Cichorium intybus TaxID=13427 RepID=A0ACB8ZSB3_CICIN|nr:hypothetical protein L2E82_45108 [Cichorium intybus]